MLHRHLTSPAPARLAVIAGCAVSLLGAACSNMVVDGAGMSTGTMADNGTGGATHGVGAGGVTHGAGSGGASGDGGSTADAGPIHGTCSSPFTALDAPGMYTFEFDGDIHNYWFLKRDDINDRCMLLHVVYGGAQNYGLAASYGFTVERVMGAGPALRR